MKILLLTNDIKWKSLKKRTADLELHFRKRLNFLYDELTIDIKPFKTDIFPNAVGQLDEMWIQNRMIKTNPGYDAVGMLINPKQWLKSGGQKNLLGGYVRDNDMKFGFYIICEENQTRKIKRKTLLAYENVFEHEFCGHGVSHDLGLKWESNDTNEFKEGYDNTHHFFYQNKLDEHYEYLRAEADKVTAKMKSTVQALKDKFAQMRAGEAKVPATYKFQPFVERYSSILIQCAKLALGYDLRITSSIRSFEEQNALYELGRTQLGAIVTNAKGGQSLHNYGVAFDLVERTRGYDIDWEALGMLWKIITNHEGEWGGNWANFSDKPHFQLTFEYTLKDFQDGKVDYKRYK